MLAYRPRRTKAHVRAAVPSARTLDLSVLRAGPDADGSLTAVPELPDAEAVHNHVGRRRCRRSHVQFGRDQRRVRIVMAAFAEQFQRALPLAVRADIRYRKLAMGVVRATARLSRPVAEVVADAVAKLDAGERSEFEVLIEIATLDGAVTAEMTVVWTLRPHR